LPAYHGVPAKLQHFHLSRQINPHQSYPMTPAILDEPIRGVVRQRRKSLSHALHARTWFRIIGTLASGKKSLCAGGQTTAITREEIFVTTKLWIQDAGYGSAKKAFERSLQRLQLDHLDLYLIHQPFGDVYCSWRAMDALYQS
jgi:Aldo/keto reductase family